MTQPEGVQVGGASFGIGIDLAQWERDLDRAEQIARSRAQRIQAALGNIPMSVPVGTIGRAGGTAIAQASAARVATAAPAGGARPVPAYIRTLYDVATSRGMAPADAKRSIARTLGLNVSDLAGLEAPGSGSVGRSFAGGGSAVGGTGGGGGGRSGGTGSVAGGASGPFGLRSSTLIRSAAAFAGVGLGLSVAVGTARLLHETIDQTVKSTIQLSQSAREVGISFGSASRELTGAGAQAFAANPTTTGTREQYLQAAAAAGPLARQFGLTTDQVRDLITAEGQLARLHGTELPAAAQALQGVLNGNLQAAQAFDVELVDQNGRLRSVGLSFDELTEAVGRQRAEQLLLRDVQADVARQMQTSSTNSDDLTRHLDVLGKAADDARNKAADLARGPVSGVTGGAADIVSGQAPPTGTPPAVATAIANFLARPDIRRLLAVGASFVPGIGAPSSSEPTQAQIDRALTAATAGQFANEASGGPVAAQQGAVTQQIVSTTGATEEANRAAIAGRQAQATIDTLNGQSELRRLAVQEQTNEVAKARIQIEQQLSPILLEQTRLQDQITLQTRENLDLREATLRAQQAAAAPTFAAQDLSYSQQRIRLLAQDAQSRAMQGLAPLAGEDIPKLFNDARTLALSAPGVQLGALDAAHRVDVAQRAQQLDQTNRALAAIPLTKQLYDAQGRAIPLQEAGAAADAASRAIQGALSLGDIANSPALTKAEQDRVNAVIAQADAASKIAAAQVAANPQINATATVTIAGLTDVVEVANAVLEGFRPQVIAAIDAAIRNPRGPSAPPTDRTGT